MKSSIAFLSMVSLFIAGCGSSSSKPSQGAQAQLETVVGSWTTACRSGHSSPTEQSEITLSSNGEFSSISREYLGEKCTGPEWRIYKLTGQYTVASAGSESISVRLTNLSEYSPDTIGKPETRRYELTADLTLVSPNQLSLQYTRSIFIDFGNGEQLVYGQEERDGPLELKRKGTTED